MRGFGGERVIRSLVSYSRPMSIRAIIATIGYKIKEDVEAEIYRDYMAQCARICTENTAKLAYGSYIKAEYADIINPKPKEQERTGEEIAADIIARMGLEVI